MRKNLFEDIMNYSKLFRSGSFNLPVIVFILAAVSGGPACNGGSGNNGSDLDAGEDVRVDHDITADDGPDAETGDPAGDGDDDDGVEDDVVTDDGIEVPEPETAIACEDDREDIYSVVLADLPPHGPELRGEVVRCSRDKILSAGEVTARMRDAGVTDVTAATGVEILRITYRTQRDGDRPGLGTARMYLPLQSRPGPVSVVVSNHGTIGLADLCAPSNYRYGTALESDIVSDYLTLPFAGTGFVVIAPDYAGLGNEGVQGYGRNDDTGHCVLDASKAVMSMLTPGSLSGDIIVTGHSQGGGSSLSGQALAETYGSGGEVAAVVPFAPGWAYRELDPVIFQYPELVPANFVALMHAYADAANFLGEDHATDYFEPSIREEVEDAVSTRCIIGLDQWVRNNAPTMADMFDAGFVDSCYACLIGGLCEGPAQGYIERTGENIMSMDNDGAPVLYIQGLADTMATPEKAGCLVDSMIAGGFTPQICVDEEADHMDVVERNMGFALQWVEAILSGDPLPRCSNEELPACE